MNEYKLVPGLDNRKMSKSYDNVIEISLPPEKIPARVRTMVTDPGRIRKDDPGNPQICSIFAFQRIFNQQELDSIETSCREGQVGCVECKNVLSARMQSFMEPIFAKRRELEKDPEVVQNILAEGAKKAREVAGSTMQEVRRAMKLSRV